MTNSVAVLALVVVGCSSDAATSGALDAGAGGPMLNSACAQERAFLAAHLGCERDEQCAIVGSCSGGFGFEAVNVSARVEAQNYSDHTSCPVFDGPTYNAVCEEGRCVARNRGHDCGGPVDAGGCEPGAEQYMANCASPAACHKRCTGPGDSARCGAASSCQQTRVSRVSAPYGLGCGDTIELWLCR